MLYLPTSDAIKFKAKGWIDVFGSRCAKGVGSFVTLSSRGDRRRLATYGGVASFLIRCVRGRAWLFGWAGTFPAVWLLCLRPHTYSSRIAESLFGRYPILVASYLWGGSSAIAVCVQHTCLDRFDVNQPWFLTQNIRQQQRSPILDPRPLECCYWPTIKLTVLSAALVY